MTDPTPAETPDQLIGRVRAALAAEEAAETNAPIGRRNLADIATRRAMAEHYYACGNPDDIDNLTRLADFMGA